MNDERSIALVHDYLLTMRGAERTFASMTDCWPQAPVFTSIFDAEAVGWRFEGHGVSTSYLQKLGIKQGGFRWLLPLFPRAFERMPVKDFDIVFSSSSAFAHGVVPRTDAVHICYCHSPFRYVWHERDRALGEVPAAARPLMDAMLNRIQRWDIEASKRVTQYIANSKITKQRIADSYGRDSVIIYPPVDVDRFGEPQAPEEYFLFVGEVVSHKRVETAIEAAHLAGKKIKVVGDGPERERLNAKYAQTVEFVGRVSDTELNDLYARCKALVVPNVEEFGIAAVEAQAAGRPVVAINQGGTSETVADGISGVLVPNGTIEEFAEVMRETDFNRFDGARVSAHARQFSADRFRQEISLQVESL